MNCNNLRIKKYNNYNNKDSKLSQKQPQKLWRIKIKLCNFSFLIYKKNP